MPHTITLYIACSIDGFIAGPNSDLSFLSQVEVVGEDYGYSSFTSTVDTVIMGRTTYDIVRDFDVEFPHANKQCYVLSTSRVGRDEYVEYVESAEKILEKIAERPHSSVFLDGGGSAVHSFLQCDAIDTLVLSIIPVLLGDGTRLFQQGLPPLQFQLDSVQQFSSGLVQLRYQRKRSFIK